MMLAGVPVPVAATAELATVVRVAGADELVDRLDHALADRPPAVTGTSVTACARSVARARGA